jgi:hypothetical protein
MSEDTVSTRRSFLKGGAIIAAPLAVAGAPAAASAMAGNDAKDRLARLEAEKAIHELHARWMHKINSGARAEAAQLYANDQCACALAGIASVATDMAAAPGVLEFAADGRTASARYAALVETQTLIAPDNTLAQMLHAQGEGMVRETEQRTLKADYVRTADGWAIAGLDFARG